MQSHLCIGPISKISPAYHEPGVFGGTTRSEALLTLDLGFPSVQAGRFSFKFVAFALAELLNMILLRIDLLRAIHPFGSAFYMG